MNDRSRASSSPEEPEPAATTKESYRSQQSLGLITQKFMNLRQRNEIMNLNDVAKELNISKRRVYDVINVLEGLGYVQKAEKNNIKWIGDDSNSPDQDRLEASVEALRQQEKVLELMIRDAQCLLQLHFEDPISRPYSYVPKNDLRTTCSPDSKSIIVKSDLDTNASFDIQVTDPSTSGGTYDMIVRNKGGVKSHALLFTHELPQEEKPVVDSPVKAKRRAEKYGDDVTLSSISDDRVKIEQEDDEDLNNLETFVLPTGSSNTYVPETPGRGLFLSPFKTLIDPTCILPQFGEDNGYIHLTAPDDVDQEPESILDIFE